MAPTAQRLRAHVAVIAGDLLRLRADLDTLMQAPAGRAKQYHNALAQLAAGIDGLQTAANAMEMPREAEIRKAGNVDMLDL